MRRSLSVLVLAAAAAGVVVACASQGGSGSVDDDQGTTPAPIEPAQPAKTSQPKPPDPPPDASAPDAKDDCVRTAPSNKCGVVPQCGCTATETCDVVDGSGNVACVAAGKAVQGAPCTSTSGCSKGLTCIFGTCHAFCDKPDTACTLPGTGNCLQAKGQGGTAVPNLDVCLINCDPRDPMACGGTTAAGTGVCFVDDKGTTDCQKGGTRTENQTCSPTDDCGPALVCVDITQGGTKSSLCKRWCRVGTADCGGGNTCGSFSTKVMIGGVEYGVCP